MSTGASRRGVLGGITGGVALAAASQRGSPGPGYTEISGSGARSLLPSTGDDPIKAAARKLLNDKHEAAMRALQSRERMLFRLRSVSDAWRESRLQKISEERDGLWAALNLTWENL